MKMTLCFISVLFLNTSRVLKEKNSDIIIEL